MYSLYHDNRNKCVSLIPHFDECCNYHMDRGLHVEGKLFDEIGMVSSVVGDLKMSVRSTDYEGWLVCDGRQVSRTTYSALWNLFRNGGTNSPFGNGDGLTTFNLPNAQGRVLGSVTSNTNTNTLSLRCTGDLVGAETHTLDVNEMPSHDHTSNATGTTIGLAQRTGFNTITETDSSPGELDLINAATLDIYNTGGGLAHNNMQPTLFIGNTFVYSGVKNESSEFNTPCSNTYVIPPCVD
jgi:microcystin-dependent protein